MAINFIFYMDFYHHVRTLCITSLYHLMVCAFQKILINTNMYAICSGLNYVPPKDNVQVLIPVLVNMILFPVRIFADVIKLDDVMRG